jgi:general secretion pathway protein C
MRAHHRRLVAVVVPTWHAPADHGDAPALAGTLAGDEARESTREPVLAARLLSRPSVEWLLRRNFWMVRLVGLMIVTALAANTSTTLLTFYLLSSTASASELTEPGDADEDDEDDEASLAAGVATAGAGARLDERARRAERTAERILGHNPFCPTCTPAPTPTPMPGAVPLEPGQAALEGARRSELPLAVAATMEADDPAHSLATLVDTTRGIGGLFGVGDTLGPQIEIVHVATGVVHIRNAGQLEYIPFDALPVPPKTEPKAADKPGKPGKEEPAAASSSIPGATEAIQCSGKGDCVVERSFVEELLAKPKLLMGQGGASPATTKDGAPGFRLRGVKKGTLPDLLGLKNGDVITEVGGSPLTMDVLPGLYGKLRHASHIEVTVDRKGERVMRQLEIRS